MTLIEDIRKYGGFNHLEYSEYGHGVADGIELVMMHLENRTNNPIFRVSQKEDVLFNTYVNPDPNMVKA